MSAKTQSRWWNSVRRSLRISARRRRRAQRGPSVVGGRIEQLERRDLLTVMFVDDTAAGVNDGSSWQDAYVDLQSALGVAVYGDEIRVAEGTYKPTGTTDRDIYFRLKNGVDLYGGYAGSGAPNPDARDVSRYTSILSGDIGVAGVSSDNSYHVVIAIGVTDATLDGFSVTAGHAEGSYYAGGMWNQASSTTLNNVTFRQNSSDTYGGGMANTHGSSPTLTNVIFIENSAHYGAGIYNNTSSATLTNVTFAGNSASHVGGGMANTVHSTATLTNVTFSENSADTYGGGMYNFGSSTATLTNVTFRENSTGGEGGGMLNGSSSTATLTNVTFRENSAGNQGGGLSNHGSSPSTLTDVIFVANSAPGGGGMLNSHSDNSPTLTNVIFRGNSASDEGGGMRNYLSSPTLTNVSFSKNSADTGGGMWNRQSSPTLTNVLFNETTASTLGGGMRYRTYSSPTLTNVTFSENSAGVNGGGIWCDFATAHIVVNSVFWGNTPQQIVQPLYSSSTITYSIVQDSWVGEGNLDIDPQFVDAANGDLHLLPISPAIDAGSNAAVNVTTDLDGNPRIVNGVVDMGAYEALQNQPPTVSADNATVVVYEGRTAANTGTVSDPDLDAVTLTASAGTITDNGDGTWSWSFDTTDGPDQTQGVTITVDDGNGGVATTTFDLTVNNVAPEASISGPATGLAGQVLSFTFGATDVSPVDQNADFEYRVDWNGDGDVDQTVSGPDGTTVQHVFAVAGPTTVIVTATDKDGGVSDPVSFQIDVIQPVDVDVKPCNGQNNVNARSQGVIPLAIYTTDNFDAATVNADTVRLEGVAADHFALEDVDHDGDLDLILHFRTQDVLDGLGLELASGETEQLQVELTGETVDAVMIQGFDTIDFFLHGKGKAKGKK